MVLLPNEGENPTKTITFITLSSLKHSKTRAQIALLGPCFKTGWLESFRLNLEKCFPLGGNDVHFKIPQSNFLNKLKTASEDFGYSIS
jgi:hypothetical protein